MKKIDNQIKLVHCGCVITGKKNKGEKKILVKEIKVFNWRV
jgi:DNA-nicking Smr family endonuclease